MAYRFKLKEPFDEGFRRIAEDQIARAERQVADCADPAVGIHETRKSIKRLRALLRLVRPALGEDVFRAENTALRDIGQRLSGARDTHVMQATLAKLDARFGKSGADWLPAVRKAIGPARNGNGAGVALVDSDTTISDLHAVGARLALAKLKGSGFAVIGAGLEKSYRRACRLYEGAYATPSDEAFHDWRKSAQLHWRHMSLLSNAWSDYFNARVAAAKALSQILGDDHDLAILIAAIERAAEASSEPGLDAAISQARALQAEFRRSARPRGGQLFAEKPKSLVHHVAVYWSTGREIAARDDGVVVTAAKVRERRRPGRPPA